MMSQQSVTIAINNFMIVFQRETDHKSCSERKRTSSFCLRYFDNSVVYDDRAFVKYPKDIPD